MEDKQSKYVLYSFLFIFSLSLLVGVYWFIIHYYFQNKPVFVFIEMKVINDKGHPVAGAEVLKSKESLGVTDSFGEWSRFLSEKRGAQFSLFVRKQVDNTWLGAKKTIFIPNILLNKEERIKTNVFLKKKWMGEETSESEY